MEGPLTGTYRTCVDPALAILEDSSLRPIQPVGYWADCIRTTLLLQLRFFQMLAWGLDHRKTSKHDRHLRSFTSTVGSKLMQIVKEFYPYTLHVGPEGKLILDQLEESIEPVKRQAKEICILSLRRELGCKRCRQDLKLSLGYGTETASFIEFVLTNLAALNSIYQLIAPAKQQINLITGKLNVFRKFADAFVLENLDALNSKPLLIAPAKQQNYLITGILKVFRKFAIPVSNSKTIVKKSVELISQTRTWANHLSCLSCLYWIDHGMDETLASTIGTTLSDLMQKTMPCTQRIIASYLEATPISLLPASYLNFLLEQLVLRPTNNDIETRREGLVFLLSFMTDPLEEDSEDRELILGQIYSIINESQSLICSIHYNEKEDRIFVTKLSDFLEKIARVEVEVRKLYAIIPCSSQFNYPRTNAIGFLDSLLQKLKKWLEREVNFVTHEKRVVQTVWEALASLRPFIQHLTELQNEQEELKYLWGRMINLVYHGSYVIGLCSGTSISICHRIICLQSVIEEIKLIKIEAKDIKDPQMYTNKMLSVEMESRDTLLPRGTTSQVEGDFIGFKEDKELVINHLIRGGNDLTIISISGMPGQGKTTLAKRIYNDPKIQCHFYKTAWCYVSKECKIRDLMIRIVNDVSDSDEDISKLEIQDLAEMLRKCLKQRKYLVVMDDIWDVEVWCQVQSSFPDDSIGSRILFTSRNHNLKSQAEFSFISYPLRLFSPEESWDLMKEKLFHCNGLGQGFLDIGKQIAICCNGLPLAVVLVASLLGKTEQKVELWNQVAENLKSHLASEGCMHIIELSYKYLPDHLRSCFLYFGAFPRGENISAKRLKLLWMAEGFIEENEMRCVEDLAGDCLDYLVSQSLVVVAERSSMGGIKTCNVHDLIYDLCLEKIAEDNFLHLIDGETFLNECHSSSQKYAHHRLCIGVSDPLIESGATCRTMKLPTSLVQSLLWLDRLSGYDFDRVIVISFLTSFKVLTVLDLGEVEMEGDVFPEEILCNIHLKYLALWERIKDIPQSIAKLGDLETLILRRGPYGDFGWRKIPDAMWRMKSLRHVRIDFGCINLEDFEGNECYVETLCGVILGDDPRTVEFLGRMTRLRKLRCRLESGQLHRAWFSIFGNLKKVEELKIISWFSPSRYVSEACSFPQNLRKLSLEGLLKCAMSTIGKQMPNLEVLKLVGGACEGRRWDLKDGEFSKLRYLKLRRFNIKQINVSDCDDPFPCLEEFIVESCAHLKAIPSEIGDIGSLNTIKMSGCSREASESVMQILQQQRDYGNRTLQVFVERMNDHEDDCGEDEEEEDNDDSNDGEGEDDDDCVEGEEEEAGVFFFYEM